MKKPLIFIASILLSTLALAQTGNSLTPEIITQESLKKAEQPKRLIPAAPTLNARAYLLIDAKTGKTLVENHPKKQLPAASLTKLMSLYIVASAIKEGQINLDDKVRISKQAWHTGGSRMFVKVDSLVSVSDLIKGVIIASGNDATMALAEYVGGTQKRFVEMMNREAQILGMKDTQFFDPTGLSDKNLTTPYDLSILASALIKNFPEDYQWYKEKWITYNNIKQPNRNRLLWHDDSVDGIKTGHTTAAGFCLIASAKRHGMRLISIVMGAPNDVARINDSAKLLNYGFRYYNTYRVYAANEAVTQTRVWFGKNKKTNLGIEGGLYITIPSKDEKDLKASITLDQKVKAPVKQGQVYGTLELLLDGKIVEKRNLVALEDNPKAGLFSRMTDHVRAWF